MKLSTTCRVQSDMRKACSAARARFASNGWGECASVWNCPEPDSNRHDRYRSRDFKSLASTDFATRAQIF